MTAVPALRRRLTNAALTLAAVAAAATLAIVVSPGGGGRTIAAACPGAGPLGAGGEFHEIDPVRVYDSRASETAIVAPSPKGLRQTGASSAVRFDVDLLGATGIGNLIDANPSEVLAVVANVTVVGPTQAGHATIFPKGTVPGESSVVNFKPGQTVANSAILRPGTDGKVTVHLQTPNVNGSAHFVVDVSGWFSTSGYETNGARVETVDPARIYDSGSTKLKGAQKVSLDIWGATDINNGQTVVPDDPNVVGVIVNLTGVNNGAGSLATHLALVPDDFNVADAADQPTTSNLNLAKGQTRANTAFVPVGADGRIHLFSLRGEMRAVVDVTGYLVRGKSSETKAGRIIPLVSPFRAFDTRLTEFQAQPLGPGRAEPWSFDKFVADVSICNEPVGSQVGLFGNLTATGLERNAPRYPSARTHMTFYPHPGGGGEEEDCGAPPEISNVNLGEAEAVPNMALMRYGTSSKGPYRLCAFNFNGYVDYLLDVYAVVLSD